MSKPVKRMIRKTLADRFQGLTSLAVVGFTGVDAIRTNEIRARLREKDIRLTVVKNSLARQAFRDMGLEAATGLLDGPCAVAFGEDSEQIGLVSIVRELLDIHKKTPQLTVKAALLDGEVFKGEGEVKALSEFPTREEAVAEVLGCVVSVGSQLAGCVTAPGSQVAALVKAVEERAEGAAEAA